MPRWRGAPPLRCAGAGLLEALIALVVFSIGIIGLLGLQANAFGTTRDAQYRAEAGVLVNEIIGTMWTDRANLAQYSHYDTADRTCAPSGTATSNANALRWLGEFTTADGSRYLPGATSTTQQIRVEGDRTVRVTICWRAPQDARWHHYTVAARIPE